MGAGRRVVPQGQADENEQSVEGQTIDEQIEFFVGQFLPNSSEHFRLIENEYE